MTDEDRFKAWAGYAEISRKWISAMDTKAGFIAALNLGLLALLWSGAKIQDGTYLTARIGAAATFFTVASIWCAVWAALPRESLTAIFGKGIRWHGNYKPISYYGYISQAFGRTDFGKLKEHADSLTPSQLADEALEQHFVLSHTAARKSGFVKIAGILLLIAASLSGLAVLTRLYV